MSSHTDEHRISFSPASHPPVRLRRGALLSEHLSVENSPLLRDRQRLEHSHDFVASSRIERREGTAAHCREAE